MQLYLNNSGSRWIDTNKKEMEFILVLPDGTRKLRRADWFESFGNYCALAYRYRGVRYAGLPKASDGGEVWDDNNLSRIPHIFHRPRD